jgi:non-heme chloroperoxidase
VNIAIQVSGKSRAAPVILIHGLNQCRLSWIRQLNSELAEHFQLVTYDLRGHGDSDKPTQTRYYAEGKRWGDELATVIEAASVHRPACRKPASGA